MKQSVTGRLFSTKSDPGDQKQVLVFLSQFLELIKLSLLTTFVGFSQDFYDSLKTQTCASLHTLLNRSISQQITY